jgi:hypothetical protein
MPFRDGVISVQGAEGALASCPTLFNGTVKVGQSTRVKLPKGAVSGDCTLTGPSPDSPPKSVRVDLKPGKAITLTY